MKCQELGHSSKMQGQKTVRVFCDCVSSTAKSRCQQVQKTGKLQSVVLLFTAKLLGNSGFLGKTFICRQNIVIELQKQIERFKLESNLSHFVASHACSVRCILFQLSSNSSNLFSAVSILCQLASQRLNLRVNLCLSKFEPHDICESTDTVKHVGGGLIPAYHCRCYSSFYTTFKVLISTMKRALKANFSRVFYLMKNLIVKLYHKSLL